MYFIRWEYLNDGSNRFLLGDSEGYLYMFILETNHNKVVNLSSTLIGQVRQLNVENGRCKG